MAKFLLIYHGGGMPETEEDKNRVMAAWGQWMEGLGSSMVDMGNPTSNVKNVSSVGVSDFNGDRVSGYSIIEAGNLDEAVEKTKGVPIIADGGTVDVYETFNAM